MPDKNIAYHQLHKAGYNRPINRSHVNNIKRNFCAEMVQAAIVSFRDGKYWIIDHQHQTQAIYELNNSDPNTQIRCDVRFGMTYEQEAELYWKLNSCTKVVTPEEKLIGRIEAREPQALEFRDTVERCGYVIGRNANDSLRAISTALKIYSKDGGAERLTQILCITNACWPNNPGGVDSRILEGLNLFLRYHNDEFKREQLIKALAPIEPKTIVSKATHFYNQMDSRAFTKPYCVYTTLINYYNTKKRNKLVPATPGA